MFVRAHVGVLHYVLSFAIIAQNSPSHAVETLVVTTHDDFKHPGLTRQHSGHNVFVTQGLLRSGHFRWVHHTNPPYDGVTTAIKVTNQTAAAQEEKWMPQPVTDSLLPTPFSWRRHS